LVLYEKEFTTWDVKKTEGRDDREFNPFRTTQKLRI